MILLVVGILTLCSCVLVIREIDQYVRINVLRVYLYAKFDSMHMDRVPFQPSQYTYPCNTLFMQQVRNNIEWIWIDSTSDEDEWTLDEHSVNAINILSEHN